MGGEAGRCICMGDESGSWLCIWVMQHAVAYAWVGKLAGKGWGRGGAAGWSGVIKQTAFCA